MPIRSPPTATRFRHQGRALLLKAGAALQLGQGCWIRRSLRPERIESTTLSYNRPMGEMMPRMPRTTPQSTPKKQLLRAASPSSESTTSDCRQPRTVRLTVSLPGDLVDRLRDAVYWSPNLKLAWLIAESIRASLADLERSRPGPFPKRMMALRAGRPRLVGQSMNVHSRVTIPGNGTAHSTEVRAQTRITAQSSME